MQSPPSAPPPAPPTAKLAQPDLHEDLRRGLGLGMDYANDAILVFTEDGRILEANQCAQDSYGYSLEEFRALSVADLREPGTLGDLPERMRGAGTRRGAVFETLHRRRDGAVFPVEVNSRLVEVGGRRYLCSVVRDVTQRKEHEAQIARLNRLYAALSQISQQVAQARSSRDLFSAVCRILVEVSRFKMAWIGWRNVETQQIEPVASHGDAGNYLASIRVFANEGPEGRGPTGVSVREDRSFVCNDFVAEARTLPWREAAGRNGFQSSISIPFHQGGRVVGALTCYAGERQFFGEKEVALCNEAGQALTVALDKFEQEAQFLRAQRLENIGMLAAGIAHDLNNVLAPISMAVPLLRRPDADPEELRVLDTLEHCAERGAGLVRQVLGFVQGVGGEPQLLQFKHVLRDVVQLVTETFPKSVEVVDAIPKDLWPVVANPTQLHQIVLNLCLNARDAMPQGGRLRLRAETLSVDAEAARQRELPQPGRWLLFQVADEGTGMAPEVLARIWEPFFTTKGAGKGTGLGLPTVRGIVEAHGGHIQVSTQLRRGTTFTIYLPAAEPSAPDGKDPCAKPTAEARTARILLVDDDRAVRELMRSLLEQAGHTVLAAEEGKAALELLETETGCIDLVVTDLDMPRMGGVELSRKLRCRRPGLRVLVISGLESEEPEERWQSFADGFLQKPFTPSELLRTVHALLPQATAGGPAP